MFHSYWDSIYPGPYFKLGLYNTPLSLDTLNCYQISTIFAYQIKLEFQICSLGQRIKGCNKILISIVFSPISWFSQYLSVPNKEGLFLLYSSSFYDPMQIYISETFSRFRFTLIYS